MSGEAHTSAEYIRHHLQNLTFGQLPDGNGGTHWGFAHTAEQAKEMGFWAFNVDTLGFSLVLGVLFLWLFRSVAKSVTSAPLGVLEHRRDRITWKNPRIGLPEISCHILRDHPPRREAS